MPEKRGRRERHDGEHLGRRGGVQHRGARADRPVVPCGDHHHRDGRHHPRRGLEHGEESREVLGEHQGHRADRSGRDHQHEPPGEKGRQRPVRFVEVGVDPAGSRVHRRPARPGSAPRTAPPLRRPPRPASSRPPSPRAPARRSAPGRCRCRSCCRRRSRSRTPGRAGVPGVTVGLDRWRGIEMVGGMEMWRNLTTGRVRRETADRVGFEPTIPLRVYRFSRPAPSATRTPVLNDLTSPNTTAFGREVYIRRPKFSSGARESGDRARFRSAEAVT